MQDEEQNRLSCSTSCKNFCGFHWKGVVSLIVPLLCIPVVAHSPYSKEFRCLYIICVMAVYWITEVIPLYVTSLIPIIAMPLLGIMDSELTCKQYFKDVLVMFLGGLMVALSIEHCNLHKRIALRTILIVGCSPRRLHFGLLFTSMFISMWISNAAATAMMCPVIRGVLEELQTQKVLSIYMNEEEVLLEGEKLHPSRIAMGYYISMAYATTIGGCGTLIGTATNLTIKGLYDGRFPNATEQITFASFMAYGCPLVLVLLLTMYLWIEFTHMGLFRPRSKEAEQIAKAVKGAEVVRGVIIEKYKELGPMSCHEIQVVILFILMILLLFMRSPGFIYGWGDFFNDKKIGDSAAMILIVIMLFCLPIHYRSCKLCCGSAPFPSKETPSLINWRFINTHLPWGLLFLQGGGYALAEGSHRSGMAKMLGEALKILQPAPAPVVQLVCIIAGIFFTAFSSNVAMCNILLPVAFEMAIAIRIHPLYLVMPIGLVVSFAFLLPVSTPPNAIVCSYANIKTKYLAAAGTGPTITTIIILFIYAQSWQYVVFPKSSEFPTWAVTDKL